MKKIFLPALLGICFSMYAEINNDILLNADQKEQFINKSVYDICNKLVNTIDNIACSYANCHPIFRNMKRNIKNSLYYITDNYQYPESRDLLVELFEKQFNRVVNYTYNNHFNRPLKIYEILYLSEYDITSIKIPGYEFIKNNGNLEVSII